MRRRGFLGALTAALAASRVLPAKAEDVVQKLGPKGTFVASGVASGVVQTGYEHQGTTITMLTNENEYGWENHHLDKNGRLVAITYPDGKTHFFLNE